MVTDIIVAFGFILIAILLVISFKNLTSSNESKYRELFTSLLEWRKQMEEQQANFQLTLLQHAQQADQSLQSVWEKTNAELVQFTEKEQQGLKATLHEWKETQVALQSSLFITHKETMEGLQKVWKQTNQESLALLEAEKVSRNELLQNVSSVQETSRLHLLEQKDQIEKLQNHNENVLAKLIYFIDETKQVAVNTEAYHKQITTDFTAFTSKMHDLFDTKVKEQHELLLNAEQTIKESLTAMVDASDSNLGKYEKAIQEITTIQHSQSQLVLLMKKAQDEHHQKLEEYQNELKEGLEELFSDKLNALNEKSKEQNQETTIILEEVKDTIEEMVLSVSKSQLETERTFQNFGSVLKGLDDSLKQTIQVTQTMQSEMKSLGEKDIKLLEKILR
ncbi:hypothetical protein [Pseudoneobacillus rhizosphaerae]|uniref:Uncharacterized protein n=1 Tax=Pseudoneobacillus rhizosphaerae TaxID=2880968 RepID=A0A9C7G6Q9_9BACI|nr:hypothetical protein [Pseudoneobacillus rhizosphaerae]CAG9606575.1 hypothetical protein NEOCIP111885_00263 [Pseudoneobacillus rhizosphaerae]